LLFKFSDAPAEEAVGMFNLQQSYHQAGPCG
jgi:hypothetical protein